MILKKKVSTTTVNSGNRRGFLRVNTNFFIFLSSFIFFLHFFHFSLIHFFIFSFDYFFIF